MVRWFWPMGMCAKQPCDTLRILTHMQSIYRNGYEFLGCQPYPLCRWTSVHVCLPQQNHQANSPVPILQAIYQRSGKVVVLTDPI